MWKKKNQCEWPQDRRAEFLRPKVCKQYNRFPSNSSAILEHKENLEIIRSKLFTLQWGNSSQKREAFRASSLNDKESALLPSIKQELWVCNQNRKKSAEKDCFRISSPRTTLSNNHFASGMPSYFSNESHTSHKWRNTTVKLGTGLSQKFSLWLNEVGKSSCGVVT